MCVKCMYIFCNHNYILYWFYNCFNVLILIFVFVCLSGFLYLVSCTCNKTVTPYDGVCLRPHAHEPVTNIYIYIFVCVHSLYRTYIYIYIYNGSLIRYWRSCTPSRSIGLYFWGVRGSWAECHSLVYQLCLAI